MIYGKVIDSITSREKGNLKIFLILFLGTQLLVQIFGILETYAGQLTVTVIENDLKNDLFRKILSFRCFALDGYMEGELFNRLEFDTETIVGYYIDIVTNSIMIICNFGISLYFIIRISDRLTLLAVLMIPLLYAMNYFSRNRIHFLQELRKRFDDRYYGFVSETLGNIRGVKIFRLERDYVKKFSALLKEKYEIEKRTVRFTGVITLVRSCISNIFDILIVYVSAMIIFHGGMTVGSMVAFNTYLAKLFETVSKVLDINLNKHSMKVNYERVEGLLEQEEETEPAEGKAVLERIEKLSFRHVDFSYGKEPVLKQISFEIKKPGLYTVTGENGSGKSTLFRLIIQLYECDNGMIFINDIPAGCFGPAQIRDQISYLEKEPFLVHGTVAENIRIGRSQASSAEIQRVCRSVGLHEDVMGFEHTYETEIGENGCRLSSGQKQKVGLARMLLQNRPVILMDEATSALDSASRMKISGLLEEMKKEKIIIHITHDGQEKEKGENILAFHKKNIKESTERMDG